MSLEADLRAWLLAQPGITALVGDRIYWGIAPQRAGLPLVTLRRVSTPRVGAQDAAAGYARPRVQFTIRAERISQTVDIAAALRQALDGFRGAMGGTTVYAVRVDSEADAAFEVEGEVFVRYIDFIFQHKEG